MDGDKLFTFSARHSDRGSLFDAKGSSCFASSELHGFLLALLGSKPINLVLQVLNPTLEFQVGDIGRIPIAKSLLHDKAQIDEPRSLASEAIKIARSDWDSYETSWGFGRSPLFRFGSRTLSESLKELDTARETSVRRLKELEEVNNRRFIKEYGLDEETLPEVPDDQITLYRPNREEDIKRLISYAIGCMMGRYSLDKPGLIYAQGGNVGFDPGQYRTFPADPDGIVPVTEADWFADDATNRFVEFVGVAWPKEHLDENLKFVADSLGPNQGEQPRDTIRRYLATGFYKHHLQTYKRRPIYWLFSSGKQRAFQCLVYLHRYHEGTLARMRTEYVIPLQGMIASRIEHLAGDIAEPPRPRTARSSTKERETLIKQQAELHAFDEKLSHSPTRRSPSTSTTA